MKRLAWTPEQDAQIVKMRDSGKTYGQIAAVVGYTDTQCHSRYRVIEKRKPGGKTTVGKRFCLGCRQEFQPQHKGQYLHEKCVVKGASPFEISAQGASSVRSTRIGA